MKYANKINLASLILKQINFLRLKNNILLPFELVGENERTPTNCNYNINGIS